MGARDERLNVVDTYFKRVDARDPRLLDLFTEDVQFFFPKFGLARGKAALAQLGERLAAQLESLEHDIDRFNYIVSGDFVVVEGTERGLTRDGLHWPDGVISQGRFVDVFEFDGVLIRRLYVYVDPDFTNADRERVRALRGEND
ncbi:MAG TPA: nuclear transport factor 2 family protein [Polyangiaceae bacterium]|nr:nuclear transport factor 2 family protein [Polyangiaceae bacterium]